MVMTLWETYDIGNFTADTILFREILCEKKDNLMFQQLFLCKLGGNS